MRFDSGALACSIDSVSSDTLVEPIGKLLLTQVDALRLPWGVFELDSGETL